MKNNRLGSFISAIATILASKKFSVIFISILSLILIFFCLKTNPIRQGDGYEYALILQSFFNHFSPDIREADITSLIKIVESQPSSYDVKVLQGILTALKNGENEIYLGILKSSQGEYFGYHFWLYPLINLPVKALLAMLRLNELKAFQLTNSLLISLTLIYVLLFSRQSPLTKWAIALLYLAGCIFFYLLWPHPEIYLAASILISGCAFIDQRIYLAAIAAALATLQNPSVVFLLAAICIFFVAKYFTWTSLENPLFLVKKYIWIALIAATTFLPYIFYYYHYQVPNLIAQRGFVDPRLISLSRFNSTLFDLNQGLIVGFPGIMVGVLTLLIYRLIRIIFQHKRPIFHQADILLVAFFLMLQPTLSQTNWNHGQEIFSRYAFWATMALIIWLAANMSELKGLVKYSFLPVILALQFFPNYLFFKHPWDGHYLKMKSPATWVLANFPGWYNPEPEIFAERVREYERFGETIAPNSIDSPFIFLDKQGYIRKILVYQDFALQTQARLCGNQGKLISLDSQYSLEKLLSDMTFNRQGWGYINGSFRCAIPFNINFAEGGNSRNFTRKGWGKIAVDGSLMRHPEATLILPIDTQQSANVKLVVEIINLAENQNLAGNLKLIINNRAITEWNLKTTKQITAYQAEIPPEILRSQAPLSVRLQASTSTKSDESLKIKVVSMKIDTAIPK